MKKLQLPSGPTPSSGSGQEFDPLPRPLLIYYTSTGTELPSLEKKDLVLEMERELECLGFTAKWHHPLGQAVGVIPK